MTDVNTQPAAPQPVLPEKRGVFRSRWFIASAIILTGVVGFGLGKVSSHRHFGGLAYMISERNFDQSKVQTRLETGLNRLLASVDATAEQKTKITAIVQKSMFEILPLRDSRREIREKLSIALKSPTVDRSAIESLRTTQLQMAERMSKRMQDTLLEVADLLSPTQRAQLVDRWQSRRWRG